MKYGTFPGIAESLPVCVSWSENWKASDAAGQARARGARGSSADHLLAQQAGGAERDAERLRQPERLACAGGPAPTVAVLARLAEQGHPGRVREPVDDQVQRDD